MVHYVEARGVPLSNFITMEAKKLRKEGYRFGNVCRARISRKYCKKGHGCCAISKNWFGGSGCRFRVLVETSRKEDYNIGMSIFFTGF